MNYINKSISHYRLLGLVMVLLIGFTISCDDRFEIPAAGSLADQTPPEANFTATPNETNYKQIDFANTSISATDFAWDFGDGGTSTDKEPTHTFPGEGDYTITLTASDKLGATNTITKTITLIEPIISFTPEILNPGFDIEGADAYRDNWRNDALGGPIQITTSPILDGTRASKLPTAGDRVGYQLITVQENKDYTVNFYYTMKTSPAGTVEVRILGGHVTDPTAVVSSTLAHVSLNDQTDANTYVAASISFSSGSNTEVAIYFTNVDCESRLDAFSITED
jgi:PKD repeat protein